LKNVVLSFHSWEDFDRSPAKSWRRFQCVWGSCFHGEEIWNCCREKGGLGLKKVISGAEKRWLGVEESLLVITVTL